MKFEIYIQSKIEIRSGNHVIYRWTDGMDGKGESSIHLPPTLLEGGIIKASRDCVKSSTHEVIVHNYDHIGKTI